jgi:hypothetical protein
VPRQQIPPEDRFLLLVTLADKTERPFTVTARERGRVDQQVNVFSDLQLFRSDGLMVAYVTLEEMRVRK